MSRHFTYRGIEVDIDAIRLANENTVALGNMNANARGDILRNGQVVKTADEIARQNHRVVTAVSQSSIKGAQQNDAEFDIEHTTVKKAPVTKKPIERQLDSGDIVVD